MTAEERRLRDNAAKAMNWKRWGPYLSERAWGTVREDYSPDGTRGTTSRTITRARAPTAGTRTAWPASRDRHQRICFALALWNGRDPILKERLFGLTGTEGNHGEDVKEYYFYLDCTPTHSLHAVPLQVSAGGVPLRATRRARTARRGRSAARVRAGRHRRLRRRPLLRRLRRVREGRRRTIS